ncbi:MAG TPA: GNAT family N-acetyltransferase [Massilibacterium sp.]|nr:GNAT family N-acetyltransferase [Massilibacterium sp.]
MNWYDLLNSYFPEEEMKDKRHFDVLLNEKGNIYKKLENDDYVVLYADFPDFLFIDYILIKEQARGKGLGKTLLNQFKQYGKPILIEVEPSTEEDPDTIKRLRFYERNHFEYVPSIQYYLRSPYAPQKQVMNIMYWANEEYSDQFIFEKMKTMYQEIYQYKDKEIYGGKGFDDVDDVFKFTYPY